MKRAKRDFTPTEFARALHRNGFLPECDSLRYVDPDGATGARVHDAITRVDPIRVARRATLAKLLRERSKAEKLNRKRTPSRIATNGET